MVNLSLSRFFLFAQSASIYAPDSDQLVGSKDSPVSPYKYNGPTYLPDLSNSPDLNSFQFLIDNMLVSGPLGTGHRELVKQFLDVNVEPCWIWKLTRCAALTPDGGCSKLLVALTPLLLESFPKTLKDDLMELDLVDLMARTQIGLGNWYGLAQLINALPLDILYQSRAITYELDKYVVFKIRRFIDDPKKYESLCARKRVQVLLAGGGSNTVFIPATEFVRTFKHPFDIFKKRWPANNTLLTPAYHIPLSMYRPLLRKRPENFFADLSLDSMLAMIDFLCYMGMKRGTETINMIQGDMRGMIDDGAVEIREGKWIHCDEVAKLNALATEDVFMEITQTLSLKDLQDIQKVGGNDILSHFIPFVQDSLLIQFEIADPAGLFKNRIQAKKCLFIPGMLPFKFLKSGHTSPELLKKYAKEIVAALSANQTGGSAEKTRKRIVSALACMDDLSYEDRVLLQWS